ncbi:hypothetical protein [Roseiarcus sp.]
MTGPLNEAAAVGSDRAWRSTMSAENKSKNDRYEYPIGFIKDGIIIE